MSHITTVALKIKDLNALKSALAEFGAVWCENQQTYKWYGPSVGDTPLPVGITKDMLGKCSHAIKLPGVNYEIGVVKMPDNTYTLAYDFYDYRPHGHDGGKLLEKFGQGLQKLTQAYACAKVSLEARAKGWMCQKQKLANGSIKLVLQGM